MSQKKEQQTQHEKEKTFDPGVGLGENQHPKEPSGETSHKHENQTDINNIKQSPNDEQKDCAKSNNNNRFDNYYNNYNIDYHSRGVNGEISRKPKWQTDCPDPTKEKAIEEKKDCEKTEPNFGRFDNFYNNYNINWQKARAGASSDEEEGDDRPS